MVSAIMPTRARPQFAAQAVEMFLAQTWPNKELVIVDDLDGTSFPVSPYNVPHVRYRCNVGRATIGEKRNIACGIARGTIIVHWDDDDIYSPDRIEHQARMLMDLQLDLVGYNEIEFLDETKNERWHYRNSRPIGATLCYWRRIWEEGPFLPLQEQEEYRFMDTHPLAAVPGEGRVTARIHPGNTSIKRPESNPAQWSKVA